MSIQIVPITEEHAEGFHACLDAVAREKMFLAQVEAMPLERVRAFVRENVTTGVAQFVALDRDTVVGWCDILAERAPALAHRGSLGMGVLATHRGGGIGRDLLAATIKQARANGITRIELEVRADNERAIKLYERMGFMLEARKLNGMRFDGVYYDSLQMSLMQAR